MESRSDSDLARIAACSRSVHHAISSILSCSITHYYELTSLPSALRSSNASQGWRPTREPSLPNQSRAGSPMRLLRWDCQTSHVFSRALIGKRHARRRLRRLPSSSEPPGPCAKTAPLRLQRAGNRGQRRARRHCQTQIKSSLRTRQPRSSFLRVRSSAPATATRTASMACSYLL